MALVINNTAQTYEQTYAFTGQTEFTITNQGTSPIIFNFDASVASNGAVSVQPGQMAAGSCTTLHYISTNGNQAFQINVTADYAVTGSKVRENPFGTETGQDIVSISENFWARLLREGRIANAEFTQQAVTAVTSQGNTFWTRGLFTADSGYRLYPRRITVSCNVAATLMVQVSTGLMYDPQGASSNGIVQHVAFVPAYTPWVVEFDGEVFLDGNAGQTALGVYVGAQTPMLGAVVDCSGYGIEVSYNG